MFHCRMDLALGGPLIDNEMDFYSVYIVIPTHHLRKEMASITIRFFPLLSLFPLYIHFPEMSPNANEINSYLGLAHDGK